MADTAVGGQPVLIDLSTRRLCCDEPDCGRHSFAEQVEGLTVRYDRRTPGLLAVLSAKSKGANADPSVCLAWYRRAVAVSARAEVVACR